MKRISFHLVHPVKQLLVIYLTLSGTCKQWLLQTWLETWFPLVTSQQRDWLGLPQHKVRSHQNQSYFFARTRDYIVNATTKKSCKICMIQFAWMAKIPASLNIFVSAWILHNAAILSASLNALKSWLHHKSSSHLDAIPGEDQYKSWCNGSYPGHGKELLVFRRGTRSLSA